MILNLTPQNRTEAVQASVSGDSITINGEVMDFAALAEGETIPRDDLDCEWLASDVTRAGGGITLTLILPYWGEAPESVRFPAPISVSDDGPVNLPTT